jgi:hypothetical protein
MKRLKELAQFISKLKVSQIKIVGNSKSPKTRSDEFYKKLLADEFQNDDDAAQYFFGTNGKDRNYQILKKRFESNLLSTIFFIDYKENNLRVEQKVYYSLLKEITACKILFVRGVPKLGVDILMRALKKATLYHLTDIAYDASKMLSRYYGNINKNEKEFEYYHNISVCKRQILDAELLSEEYYNRLFLMYRKERINLEQLNKQAQIYYNEIEPLLRKFPYNRLHLTGRLIQLLIIASKRDLKGLLSACNEAIDFFESLEVRFVGSLQIYLQQKALACLQLKQFEEGKTAIIQSIACYNNKNVNWFWDHYAYALLSLHSKDYQKAKLIFIEVNATQGFDKLPQHFMECWRIIEAYLNYLSVTGKITNENLKYFRLQKFINEVPVFASDKRVLNIPILVIQILFLLHEAKTSQSKQDIAIDRINAIEQYCSRYLRRSNNFRSNCFIKMLLQIPAGHFNKIAVKRKAEEYIKKLYSEEMSFATQSFEIEIVPYEVLWELALESLL